MRPADMHRELCGCPVAAGDDSGVVRRPIVAKVMLKLFPSTLGHDVPPMISHLARLLPMTGTSSRRAALDQPGPAAASR